MEKFNEINTVIGKYPYKIANRKRINFDINNAVVRQRD
jgi:hypothetical protein